MTQVIRENGVWTIYGLSTDDKDEAYKGVSDPSFAPILFKELDTGKVYYYDTTREEWAVYGGGA